MKSFLRLARIGYGPLVVSGVLLLFLVSAFPQGSSRNLSGRWVWKEIAHKDKPQRQFRLVIRQDGNVLKGVYSVDEFINGEWQGEDGNQTPFIGNLKGNHMQIEFDPLATEPGYEQIVSYAAPSNGRKPSLAVMTRSGSNLRWRLVRGPGIRGVPKNMILNQERQRDRARF